MIPSRIYISWSPYNYLLPLIIIMSISKHPITELKQSNVDSTQLGEPTFFTRLPTEIRLLIYENLFGWRTVHMRQHSLGYDFRLKKSEIRWRHRLCCRDPQRDFMQHMVCCSDNVSKYPRLDTSILFTCRQAWVVPSYPSLKKCREILCTIGKWSKNPNLT
jgi:hypothetical protein